MNYTSEMLEALYHMGLSNIVWDTRTHEVLAAFFKEDDADEYVADPVAGHIRAWVVNYGPAVHLEFVAPA
jgi:hypothetical protein